MKMLYESLVLKLTSAAEELQACELMLED